MKETLEEAAENHHNTFTRDLCYAETRRESFIEGVRFQQERSYSEEEVLIILQQRDSHMNNYHKLHGGFQTPKEWFEQFKKK